MDDPTPPAAPRPLATHLAVLGASIALFAPAAMVLVQAVFAFFVGSVLLCGGLMMDDPQRIGSGTGSLWSADWPSSSGC